MHKNFRASVRGIFYSQKPLRRLKHQPIPEQIVFTPIEPPMSKQPEEDTTIPESTVPADPDDYRNFTRIFNQFGTIEEALENTDKNASFPELIQQLENTGLL